MISSLVSSTQSPKRRRTFDAPGVFDDRRRQFRTGRRLVESHGSGASRARRSAELARRRGALVVTLAMPDVAERVPRRAGLLASCAEARSKGCQEESRSARGQY